MIRVVRPFSICVRIYSLLLTPGKSWSVFGDLSKATNLGDVVFRPVSLDIEWIITALRTMTPEHRTLRQISIHAPYHSTLYDVSGNARQAIGETVRRQWSGLDRFLVQF